MNPEIKETPEAPQQAAEKLRQMGSMTRDETIMLGTMLLAVVLWVMGDAIGVPAVVAAMLGLVVLLVTGVLKWADCLEYKSVSPCSLPSSVTAFGRQVPRALPRLLISPFKGKLFLVGLSSVRPCAILERKVDAVQMSLLHTAVSCPVLSVHPKQWHERMRGLRLFQLTSNNNGKPGQRDSLNLSLFTRRLACYDESFTCYSEYLSWAGPKKTSQQYNASQSQTSYVCEKATRAVLDCRHGTRSSGLLSWWACRGS